MHLIKSGVPGLDDILKGGIKAGSAVLITGAPGTGKTIVAIQFLLEGAKNNEPGLFISAEETIEEMRNYARVLGLELDAYEEKGLITFIQQQLSTKTLVSIATPLDIIKHKKIQRVALDSLTMFEYTHVAGVMDYRKEVLDFISRMKESAVTLLVTAEKSITDIDVMEYDPQDFLFDGLIILFKIRKTSSYERCLTVAKMRGQQHSIDIFPFVIEDGVKVLPSQVPFSLIEKDIRKR